MSDKPVEIINEEPKEATILNLPAVYTKEERAEMEEYRSKAIELETRLNDHLKKGIDEFNNWLKSQGFQLAAKSTILGALEVVAQAVSQSPLKNMGLPVGIEPLPTQEPEA